MPLRGTINVLMGSGGNIVVLSGSEGKFLVPKGASFHLRDTHDLKEAKVLLEQLV